MKTKIEVNKSVTLDYNELKDAIKAYLKYHKIEINAIDTLEFFNGSVKENKYFTKTKVNFL